jgi:ABC-type transport system involved in resistance to organic solvents, auxiliary component
MVNMRMIANEFLDAVRSRGRRLTCPWWQAVFVMVALLGAWVNQSFAVPAPEQVVKDTSEQLRSAVRAEREVIKQNPKRLYQLMTEIVEPHVDVQRITRGVLGKHWKSASPAQRERFTREFRNTIIRTYASTLTNYTEVEVRYLLTQMESEKGKATVRTEVLTDQTRQGRPITIHYRLWLDNGVWKAYDVAVDGVSIVTSLRAAVEEEINRVGLEQMIEDLTNRNQEKANSKSDS